MCGLKADGQRRDDKALLKRARWRIGLMSLAVTVAGLALLVANVLTPLGGGLAIAGVVGLNLVRVAR